MSKKIIIVGAGPGGLSAGMLLAKRGYSVEIFEKNNIPGGRNGHLQLGEYKFDIGPTFFMMDYVLRSIFQETGRDLKDYVKLTKLDPMYRLFLPDGKTIDISSDHEKMRQELARVFPGDEGGQDKFYRLEKRRLTKLFPILSRHNNNILDAFRPGFLASLPYFSIGRSLFGVMGDYFKNELTKLSFTFQAKYLGMSPWECPGAFAMVPFVEHDSGIWHLEGGLSEASSAMAKAVVEDGGVIHYNSSVQELILEGKKAVGVKLETGEKISSDAVIVNADFGYTMLNLAKGGVIKKWSKEKLSRKKMSCSIFMMYLGIKGLTDLEHHNIVFAKNYRQNVNDIFSGKLTREDFSLYVRDATKTDSTLAPSGKTALYVLVPVPNNRSGIDWKKESADFRAQTLKIMEERLGLKNLEEKIEEEKIISPADWEEEYNVYEGAVFNLGHNLSQMLWFRPHNQFEELENVYLAGGGTHPGSGLPTIYQSGKIVADLISKENI